MAGALGLAAAMPGAEMAQDDSESFQTTLEPLNGSGGTGHASLQLEGGEATVTVNDSGLAEEFQDGPFPHAQHIHIAGQGECLEQSADENGEASSTRWKDSRPMVRSAPR